MPQGYAAQGITREEMIEKFLPLVNRIANRLAIGLPAHVDRGDLISSGIMGLMDALAKYNPSKGPMQKYIPLRIRGAMVDELRKMSWLPRSLMTKTREVDQAYASLCAILGRTPSEAELATRLNMGSDEVNMLLAQINTKSLVHLEDYLFSSDGRGKKVEDSLQDSSDWANPEANILQKEMENRLAEAIDTLPEREQLILHLYYREELTLKEIGQVLDVSESRVSQIHSRIMLTLRNRLTED